MKPTIPTPAEAVRLLIKRACMTISREYAYLAGTVEVPDTKVLERVIAKARGKAPRRPAKRG